MIALPATATPKSPGNAPPGQSRWWGQRTGGPVVTVTARSVTEVATEIERTVTTMKASRARAWASSGRLRAWARGKALDAELRLDTLWQEMRAAKADARWNGARQLTGTRSPSRKDAP